MRESCHICWNNINIAHNEQDGKLKWNWRGIEWSKSNRKHKKVSTEFSKEELAAKGSLSFKETNGQVF